MRLAIGPSPRRIELPKGEIARVGRGAVLRDGADALVIAYGPVLLHEALTASELLAEREELAAAVVCMPWLNRFDEGWLDEVAAYDHVFVVEDHSSAGGLADALRRHVDGTRVTAFGVVGWPACGTPQEALRFHGLDGASLADRLAAAVRARVT
jgi:transketolase